VRVVVPEDRSDALHAGEATPPATGRLGRI
jgi:hypothetical protein